MIAVKAMEIRDNFKTYCDKAALGETIFVARKENGNVVIISEKEYNNMLKAIRNAEYLEKIDESITEIKHGNIISISMEDLEAMEDMTESEAKEHIAW